MNLDLDSISCTWSHNYDRWTHAYLQFGTCCCCCFFLIYISCFYILFWRESTPVFLHKMQIGDLFAFWKNFGGFPKITLKIGVRFAHPSSRRFKSSSISVVIVVCRLLTAGRHDFGLGKLLLCLARNVRSIFSLIHCRHSCNGSLTSVAVDGSEWSRGRLYPLGVIAVFFSCHSGTKSSSEEESWPERQPRRPGALTPAATARRRALLKLLVNTTFYTLGPSLLVGATWLL